MKKAVLFKSLVFGGLSAGLVAGSVGALVACSNTATTATVTKLLSQSAQGQPWDGYDFKSFLQDSLKTPEGQPALLTSQAQLLIYEWYKNNSLNDSDGKAVYRSASSSAQSSLDSAKQSAKDTYRTDWENNYQKNTLDKNGGSEETFLRYTTADTLKTNFVNSFFSELKFGLLQQPEKEGFKKYGPRVSVSLNNVIPATVKASDLTSATLKYGFAPTGEYNTDEASTTTSLFSYLSNTYKYDRLKADFQGYVFDKWFASERPLVVKTALFKYAAPSAGANAIYPTLKYGTSVAAGLNFPMFGDESTNSKTVDAEDAYTYFMKYVANVPSEDQNVIIPQNATMDSSATIIGTMKDLFTTYGTVWAASVLGIDGTAIKTPAFIQPTAANQHALMDNFIATTGQTLSPNATNNDLIAAAVENNQSLTTQIKNSNGWTIAADEFGVHVSTMDRFVGSNYDWSEAGIKGSEQIFLYNLLRGIAGSSRTVNGAESVTYDLLSTLKTYFTTNFDSLMTGFASASATSEVPGWVYADQTTAVKNFGDIQNGFYQAGGLINEDKSKNDILYQIDSLANYNNTLIKALQQISWQTAFEYVMRNKLSTIAQTANGKAFTGGFTAYGNGMLASFGSPDTSELLKIDQNGRYPALSSRAPTIMTDAITVDFATLTSYVDNLNKIGYSNGSSELLIANNQVIDYAMFQLRKSSEYANIVKYLYQQDKLGKLTADKKIMLYSSASGVLDQNDAGYTRMTELANQLSAFNSDALKSEYGVANADFASVLANYVYQYQKITTKDTDSFNSNNVISTADRKNLTLKTTLAYLLQPAIDSSNKPIVLNGQTINNYQQSLLNNLMGFPLATRFVESWTGDFALPNGNPNGTYAYSLSSGPVTGNSFFSYAGTVEGAYGSTSNVVYGPDKTFASLNYVGGATNDLPEKVNSVLFASGSLLSTLAANYGVLGLMSGFTSRALVDSYVTQLVAAYETGGHAYLDSFIQQLRTSFGLLLTDAAQSSLTDEQRSSINTAFTEALSQYSADAKQTSLKSLLDLLDNAAGTTKDGIKYNGKPISLYSGTIAADTLIKAPNDDSFVGEGNIKYKVTAANDDALISYSDIMNNYTASAIAEQLKKPIAESYQFIKDLLSQAQVATTQSAAVRYFMANHAKYTGELTTDERDSTKPAGTETKTIHDRTVYDGLGSADYLRGYGDA